MFRLVIIIFIISLLEYIYILLLDRDIRKLEKQIRKDDNNEISNR